MALCFDGTTQVATIPSGYTNLFSGQRRTFSMWIKPRTNRDGFIVNAIGLTTGPYLRTRPGTNQLFIGYSNGLVEYTVTQMTDDAWMLVTVDNFAASSLPALLTTNGKILTSLPSLPIYPAASVDLRLGQWGGGSGLGYSGKIWGFYVWDRFLEVSERLQLLQGTVATSGLVARWNMTETSGTTIADSVGSNPGTVSGATWDTDAPTFSASSSSTPQHPMYQQVIG